MIRSCRNLSNGTKKEHSTFRRCNEVALPGATGSAYLSVHLVESAHFSGHCPSPYPSPAGEGILSPTEAGAPGFVLLLAVSEKCAILETLKTAGRRKKEAGSVEGG